MHANILTKLKKDYFCVTIDQVNDSLKYFLISSTCYKLNDFFQKASIFKCYIDIGNIQKKCENTTSVAAGY